jgi:hypothetical protein
MESTYEPAHSCEHCRRIVLRREHFTKDICRIRLPHTAGEINRALKDGCELIRLFFYDWRSDKVLTCKSALQSLVLSDIQDWPAVPGKLHLQRLHRRSRRCLSLFRARLWAGHFYLVIGDTSTIRTARTLDDRGSTTWYAGTGYLLSFQYDRIWKVGPEMSLKAFPGTST